MKKGIRLIRNAGFTLIEVLVTVVVIGVLAAVVIPAVTSQVTAGDSSRVISDLNNLRTGIENFDIAVRQFPGDVDDLVNKPGNATTTGTGTDIDADITGALYAGTTLWAGPYMEASLPSTMTSSSVSVSGAAFSTGYAGTVNNKFLRCGIATGTCSGTDYVVIEIDNLTAAQIGSLNDLIDGSTETSSSTAGKWRTSGTTAGLYFATPYK